MPKDDMSSQKIKMGQLVPQLLYESYDVMSTVVRNSVLLC